MSFILASLGIDWKNEISREQFDLSTAILALENGEIDALLWSGYSPNTELSDLLNSTDAKFKLIPITSDEAKTILRSAPGVFHQTRIAAGMYSSVDEDIDTLGTTVVLAAMQDFPEEHAIQILMTFFAPSSAPWKIRFPLNLEASIALMSAEARSYLHQGAADYFTEQGELK